ncbi:MAG: helicase C-terminal domain-containing protein [Thermoplasmatota archaeon]
METESYSDAVNGGVVMGLSNDIAQALERRKHMLALIPLKGELPRSFISSIYKETRKARKKLILLAPMKDVPWIASVVRGEAAGTSDRNTVATFTSRDLKCHLDDSNNDTGDLLNHCVRKEKMDSCPYQSGFDLDIYREIRESGGSLLGDMTEDIKAKGMCPARLAVDLSTEAQAIVTDYSFVFSEGWDRLFQFMGRDTKDCILGICDPSALTDYLWERFTYSFDMNDLHIERWEVSGLSDEGKRSFRDVLEVLGSILENSDEKKPLERKVLVQKYRDLAASNGTSFGLGNLVEELKGSLARGRFETISGRKMVKDMYLFLKLWMKEHSSVARSVEITENGRRIVLSILDLHIMIKPILRSFPSVVLFGDTLYPQGLYTTLLGLDPEDTLNRSYISKEQMMGTRVIAMSNVDTSYNNRSELQWRNIVENLDRISATTPGTCLVVFPSYYIQEMVMESMKNTSFPTSVLLESRGMHKTEKRRILDEVKLGGNQLLLSVQGGYMARSVEDGTFKPDTIVMVGVHIPPPSPVSSQMKVHMQKRHGTNLGHLISVFLPAMTKVMRVVNSMAGEEGDRKNLVILMDRRYQDRKVLESLPRFYDIKLLSGGNDYDGGRYFN